MTHHPSRKQFFAKLFGATAVFGLLPGLFAKAVASTPAKGEAAPVAPVLTVRPEARAVPRGTEQA